MIYTVTLAPALDYAMWLGLLRGGALHRAEETQLRVGGKGINVSVMLRRLGMDSVCLGFAGGFVGEEIVRRVRDQGVAEDFIRLAEGCSRINVKIKADTETELNAAGPDVCAGELRALYAQLAALRPGDVLVLSGNPPLSFGVDIYQEILEAVRRKGLSAVVDATGPLLLHTLPYAPLLVKPNLAELADAVGRSLLTPADTLWAARWLQQRGAVYVLVSLGGDGAILATPGAAYHCEAPAGLLVNSTGAGDSMVAAFLHARSRDMDDPDTLRYCVAAGSASAFSRELAARADVLRLFQALPVPAPILEE